MKRWTLSATGDSLFTADIPEEYFRGDFREIVAFMAASDIRMTNLETNIGAFGTFPNAYSGGTWLNCTPEDFDCLARFGFNYYSTANNHCMDYSYHGLLSTIEELDRRLLAHSGTGRSLAEAGAPAEISVGTEKIGVIAVDTSFAPASRAGEKTRFMEARPGVNYLGYREYFPLTETQYLQLKEIAETSCVNGWDDLFTSGGFALESPDGVYKFGGATFCYDGSKKKTECEERDKERLVHSIAEAKTQFDSVVLAVHCHAIGWKKHEEVPAFLEEFCHAAIDAGASAVICNGTHELRPLEIYRGAPIFYSLGDFIYQGMRVKYLPADFMVKYGLDINATAEEGLMARSKGGKIGLQAHRCNFLTVLPRMTFENGRLISLQMLPIVAGFGRTGKSEGLPYVAKGKEAEEIYEILDRLSRPYGTHLYMENGQILWHCEEKELPEETKRLL